MSGIYASLRQAQIIILEILNVWMPVPLYLSGVVIIFAFLDLGKNISFSDSLLVPLCMVHHVKHVCLCLKLFLQFL